MTAISPARWAELSPHLDALLDLPAPERAAQLHAVRAGHPRLADELQALIERAATADALAFLETPLGPGDAGHVGMACGAWTLERVLGSGGMGSVWLACRSDGRYEGRAAVKLPHPSVVGRGGLAQFQREGRLLGRLAHPHIAALLDAGMTGQAQPYLVLEYVQGEPIDRWCDAHRASVDHRVSLAIDMLDAVAHAHGQLVLHRDLKPGNVLVTESAQVKLLDFGIAKLIDPGMPGAGSGPTTQLFTPDYAAPEQLKGEPATTATDVYAAGVLLYELLAGRHPTTQPTQPPIERLRAVVEQDPLPLAQAVAAADDAAVARRGDASRARLVRTLRGDLEIIVAKALRKDPAQRYGGAGAFADDLRRWQRGEPVQARRATRRYRLYRYVARHRVGVGVAALSVVLLCGGIVGTAWQAAEARRERDEARRQAERAFARSVLYNQMIGATGSLDAPLTQRQLLDRAVAVVEAQFANQPAVAVDMLLPIAGQFHNRGDPASDLRVMQRAADLAQRSGDVALIAQVACSTVDTYLALGRSDDAHAALQRARAALAALASTPVGVEAECLRYEAVFEHQSGRLDAAIAAAERAKRLVQQRGDVRGNSYASILSLLSTLKRDNGDIAGALAELEAQMALERQRSGGGDSIALRGAQRQFARFLLDAGEVGSAHAALAALVARWGEERPPPSYWVTLASAQLELADPTAAERSLGRVPEAGEWEAPVLLMRARAALAAGRLADARLRLAQARAVPNSQYRLRMSTTAGTLEAQLLLAEGDGVAARRAIEAELARLAQDSGDRRLETRAATERTAARIALAVRDPAAAEQHARRALDAAARSARNAEASATVGEARLLAALALRDRGQADAARALAAQAAAALERGLGAVTPLVDQARSLAAR